MTISTLLVANRGEIARRIMRTARAMGMVCVAVYVDADSHAPFVSDADVAFRLTTSYLDAEAILEAARLSGADAIHPGYGFLSENATFADAVVNAGLIWVGPPASAIRSMGDKLESKRLASQCGVPTLGYSEDPHDADQVGYPVLVKASAGGGGKGMRIVERPEDLDDAVLAARREAAASFGDDTVFLEHYVARSRHIEIQILGDSFGELIHLGERECSIQRRHQKLIEESPSPVVDHTMREAMGRAALALARSIGYQSAGTVEFLVDDASHEFFFLEANTRLQVEHPVTEEITGIDLVREQLRVAAGEPLGYQQRDVVTSGHAIEVRLCAEDPTTGFLPSTGTLRAFAPALTPEVRWECGVTKGSVIGLSFDSMLAKVIARAPTRAEAATALARALERLHIGGVTTNRDFLAATLRHSAFLAGDTTTDFIERHQPALGAQTTSDERLFLARAVTLWLQAENHSHAHVWADVPSGWRNARLPDQNVRVRLGLEEFVVHYASQRDGSFRVGASHARIHNHSECGIDVEIDAQRSQLAMTRYDTTVYVQSATSTLEFEVLPRFELPGMDIAEGSLAAPMPGTILEVRVAAGEHVTKGTTLVVMEAMKMEHRIVATADGDVLDVLVHVGQQVDNGAILLVIEPTNTEE